MLNIVHVGSDSAILNMHEQSHGFLAHFTDSLQDLNVSVGLQRLLRLYCYAVCVVGCESATTHDVDDSIYVG